MLNTPLAVLAVLAFFVAVNTFFFFDRYLPGTTSPEATISSPAPTSATATATATPTATGSP
jgi:hypothetical protein